MDDPCLAIYGESHSLPQGNYAIGIGSSNGNGVWYIRYFLNWKYGYASADEGFHEGVAEEVKKYQKEKGLNEDGIVGPATGSAMQNEWSEGTKTPTVYYQYRTGVKTYQYSREVTGSWSNWSTTKPSGSNIKLEERYKY